MNKLKVFLFIPFLLSCHNDNAEKATYEYGLIARSDSVTNVAQQTLLKNLTATIQEGGFARAIDFCNAEAIPLTRSALTDINASLQRISDRNRNPDNNLKTQTDKEVFAYFKENEMAKDTLVAEKKQYVYYKRINLAMPTCMNCHGSTANMDPSALARIDAHYPADKARDYELNELRGLWKLTYQKE